MRIDINDMDLGRAHLVQVEALNMSSTLFDTSDLSTLRGSSLTLRTMPLFLSRWFDQRSEQASLPGRTEPLPTEYDYAILSSAASVFRVLVGPKKGTDDVKAKAAHSDFSRSTAAPNATESQMAEKPCNPKLAEPTEAELASLPPEEIEGYPDFVVRSYWRQGNKRKRGTFEKKLDQQVERLKRGKLTEDELAKRDDFGAAVLWKYDGRVPVDNDPVTSAADPSESLPENQNGGLEGQDGGGSTDAPVDQQLVAQAQQPTQERFDLSGLVKELRSLLSKPGTFGGESYPFHLCSFGVEAVAVNGSVDCFNAVQSAIRVGQLKRWSVNRPTAIDIDPKRKLGTHICSGTGVLAATKAQKINPQSVSAQTRRELGRKMKRELYRLEFEAALENGKPTKAQRQSLNQALEIVTQSESQSGFVNDFETLVRPLSAQRGAPGGGSAGGVSVQIPQVLQNKMAVIYLDGNKFGKHMADVAAARGFDVFAHESVAIQRLWAVLLAEIVLWLDSFNGTDLASVIDKDGARAFRFETLLWAGDEVMFAVPSWLAFDLIDVLAKSFSKWKPQNVSKELTVGIGVALLNRKTPISTAKSLAAALADRAKEGFGAEERLRSKVALMAFEGLEFNELALDEIQKHLLPGENAKGASIPLSGWTETRAAFGPLETGQLATRQIYRLFNDQWGKVDRCVMDQAPVLTEDLCENYLDMNPDFWGQVSNADGLAGPLTQVSNYSLGVGGLRSRLFNLLRLKDYAVSAKQWHLEALGADQNEERSV